MLLKKNKNSHGGAMGYGHILDENLGATAPTK